MTNEELLLAIHNQCEATQNIIGEHYKPCPEILQEALFLQSLLMTYIFRSSLNATLSR